MYVSSVILLCLIHSSASQTVTVPPLQPHFNAVSPNKIGTTEGVSTVSTCCGDQHESTSGVERHQSFAPENYVCSETPSRRHTEGKTTSPMPLADCCRLYLHAGSNTSDQGGPIPGPSVHYNVSLHGEQPKDTEVWGYGILFTTIINLSSVAGAVFLPLTKTAYYPFVMTTFIGLAVGSLTSASLFHLLPQAFEVTDNLEEPRKYLMVSVTVLAGVYLFFLIERVLKLIIDMKNTRRKVHMELTTVTEAAAGLDLIISESNVNKPETIGFITGGNVFKESSDEKINNLPPIVWMIVIGDGIHNFIDGVSIGTAFKKHILTGISMSIAVLCEEFPHELGDFAVLISSGMSFKKALGFNFLSACMCYVGLIVGILVGSIDQASNVVFGIAGGMFLYIPLANMVPEMNDQIDKACSYSIKRGMILFLLQNIGMLVGVILLFLLSYYDHYFEFV